MKLEKFKERIEHRKLKAINIFFASILSGLNEFGLLNQGIMDFAARETGKKLADFIRIKGLLDSVKEGEFINKTEQIIKTLNEVLQIGEVNMSTEGDIIAISVKTNSCRYCPKGVGGAELEGTICPFPGLIEEFLNAFLDEKIKLVSIGTENKPLIKKGDYCICYYKLENHKN